MTEWRVIQNTNPRLPPFAVYAKAAGREAPAGAMVWWEGEAADRLAAWNEAGKRHDWLAKIPPPDTYQSTNVFARRKVEPRVNDKGNETPDLERIERLLKSEANGLTCAQVEDALGMLHQTASARLNELTEMGRVQTNGKRPKVYMVVSNGRTPKSRKRRSGAEGARRESPRHNGNTERFRNAILDYTQSQGSQGATLDEVRQYIITNIVPGLPKEEVFPKGVKKNIGGTIQSRVAELKCYGFLVPHPEGLRRPTGRGRQMADVFVFTPTAVLFTWADRFSDLASEPEFKPVHDAIKALRGNHNP